MANAGHVRVDAVTGLVLPTRPFAQILSTTTGIDGKAVGATNLYTVPTGKVLVSTKLILRLTTVGAAITGAPQLGAGVAAGETDIFTSMMVMGFTLVDTYAILFPAYGAVVPTAAQVVKLGIDTGFTSVGTVTLEVDLEGYLL